MKVDTVWLGDPQQHLPFFQDLSDTERRHPALVAVQKQYSAEATVIAKGSQPANLFLLLSGVARLIETAPQSEGIQATVFLARSLIPAEDSQHRDGLLLLDGAANSVSVQTVDSCLFLALPREEFLDFLARSPGLIPRLFASLRADLRAINGKLLTDILEKQASWIAAEREQHRLLNQVPLAASETESVEEALKVSVDRICSCLGWPVGHLYSLDESQPGELFSSSIWQMRTPGLYEEFKRLSDITAFATGVCVPGRVLANREPFWTEDLSQLSNSPRAKVAKQVGLRTGLGVPIRAGEEITAVLEFFSPKLLPPDPQLMETLNAIGTRLGRVMERKRQEQQLVHNAYHDILTGLPNRALFLDHLSLSLARAKRHSNYLFAVLFLDLDRFKVINDSLGHLLADRSLMEVSRRLQGMLRATDTVARFGGDEFAILLDDLREISNVPRSVERIRKELQAPIRLGEREVYTSASIGVVLSSSDYSHAEDILQDADIALYQAKTQGRARYVIFDSAMRERAMRLLQVETELRQALEKEELRIFYQPIVSLEHGRITGFEALLRWQHPERGIVPAGEFLPVAEETEIILPISEWILQEVCGQLRIWQKEFPGNPQISVSVNLTTKYLAKADLVEEIIHLIEENEVDPRCLRLEITESQIMEDPKAISKTLLQLSEYGVQVYIDDFGTGYSSLSYLSNFRVQALKIDYSFISKLNGNDRDSAIVRAVVGLGLNLGLDVVAEGVETPDQLDFLRTVRCQYAQGYYFCRPVDKESAARLLAAGGRLDKEVRTEASRLRAFELFAGLGETEINEIAPMVRTQAVEKGATVIRQGQVGSEVYLLESGSVEILREDRSGSHFVAQLEAPAFFGERALLDPERIRTASVKASTDLQLLVLRIDSFLALLRKFPSLREHMRELFVERT
ncbi:MAG: EAL domain-containing protein [Acidobacteria bacterium]|nr:EAL domain-containing protein [Acidobacteriota bacterium]